MKTITRDEIRAAFQAGSEAKERICATLAENLCEANPGGDFRYNDGGVYYMRADGAVVLVYSWHIMGGFIACDPCLNVTAYIDAAFVARSESPTCFKLTSRRKERRRKDEESRRSRLSKMKPSIILAAEQAWPEDEASLTFDTFSGRMADAQSDQDRRDDSQAFLRDIAHMHKVFSREPDSSELIARYDAELVQRFKARHKFAFADLSRYAADDADDLFRLPPLMDSKSIAELVSNRDALTRYLPCTCAIDEMHAELGRLSP